jgi:SAM-dependent methyltransferase
MLEDVPCYLCHDVASSELVLARDDLTGKPGRFRFVTCDRCGLAFQSPRIRIEHIREYYGDEYIAHRKKTDWGLLTPAYNWAMGRHDARKTQLVARYVDLNASSRLLDVGCGAGTFLQALGARYRAHLTGVDFIDLAHLPGLRDVDFRCGLFYEQDLPRDAFDLVTMWHFLEHDYDPARTLATAREVLAPRGVLIVEVPRLDSVTFRLYAESWPGLQAPQHTVLYTRGTLLRSVARAGLEVIEYLPYGAFPAYFYLFAGLAFKLLGGRGLNLSKAIYPYFAGQLLLAPLLLFERRLNLAMQTVVCRRPA